MRKSKQLKQEQQQLGNKNFPQCIDDIQRLLLVYSEGKPLNENTYTHEKDATSEILINDRTGAMLKMQINDGMPTLYLGHFNITQKQLELAAKGIGYARSGISLYVAHDQKLDDTFPRQIDIANGGNGLYFFGIGYETLGDRAYLRMKDKQLGNLLRIMKAISL